MLKAIELRWKGTVRQKMRNCAALRCASARQVYLERPADIPASRGLITGVLLCFLAGGVSCGSDDARSPDQGVDSGLVDGWEVLPGVRGGAIQEIGVTELAGKIYVVGGFNGTLGVVTAVRVYDVETDRWSDAAVLPQAMHHANVASVDGKVYLLGALLGTAFSQTGQSWSYDPMADEWTELARMSPSDARGAAAVGVIDGKIYLAGGFRNGAAVNNVSVYNPVTDQWDDQLPDLPQPSDHLVGGVVDGVFYVIGGRDGTIGSITGQVVAFDPATPDGWTTRAAMPTPRGGMAAGVVGGKILVVGGEGNRAASSGVFPQVESYDAAADTWAQLPPMRTPRHGMGAAGYDGKLYIPGGATKEGFGAVATFESYTPSQ
ncbi:MAG: kelch repeat-containing protein [Proteobacteria bacterium]|nr:kelch repeat-containing protein [Pseudomonadota bacterium]